MTIEEIRDKVLSLEMRAERENQRHCFLEERIVILEKTQAGVQDIRLMIERLSMGTEQTKQAFSDLNARLDKLDQRLAKRIDEIDKRLEQHTSQPGEKWEKAKWAVLTLILGGVVGYIIKVVLP